MKGRVLLVEDSRWMVKLLTELLTIHGYEVVSTCCADEVLRLVEEPQPQVILMDINLPDTDGLTLTRQIKQGGLAPKAAIVAFTTGAMREDEARALQAGCDGFVSKPIHLSSFLATVDRFCNGGSVAHA